MKPKYSIGYLILILTAILVIYFAFAFTNNIEIEEYEAKIDTNENTIINSNSNEVISEGYYLRAYGDYIIVYLYDNITIFEETDILLSSLNESLQLEIQEGKYIKTTEALYGFLENYTS